MVSFWSSFTLVDGTPIAVIIHGRALALLPLPTGGRAWRKTAGLSPEW